MSRRNITILVTIMLFGFAVVSVLYALADKPFSYEKDFTRTIRTDFVSLSKTTDLINSNYYLAGVTDAAIYFGNRMDSLALLIVDRTLSDTCAIRIEILNECPNLKESRIEIDSPFFYIKAGALPGIFMGTLTEWKAARILDSITFFEQAVPISPGSFAYQAEGGTSAHKTRINFLCKASPSQPVLAIMNLLEGQVDNYYSTLGTLRFSKTLGRLVYTYTYRDEYLVLDTALTLLHKATSIGTVSRVHIKPLEISKGVYTLASTSAIVNRGTQVYGNRLFVHSNLMGRNESREKFDHASVIDVYDLKTRTYMLSFYLPDYKSIRLSAWRVTQQNIIALYDHYVVIYDLTVQ